MNTSKQSRDVQRCFLGALAKRRLTYFLEMEGNSFYKYDYSFGMLAVLY